MHSLHAATPPPPTPESQLFYSNLTVLRLNPLGLQNQFELDYRRRLYDPGDSLLKSQNYASIGIAPLLTPALVRLGVTAKIQPLAILKLEAKWEYLNYFGNFDYLQSWPTGDVDFSDSALQGGSDDGRAYATDGWQATFDVELRGKVGPVIARSRFKAGYQEVALRDGDRVFYEPYFDLLLPRQGWFFTNDLDVIVQVTPQLLIGARYSYLSAALGDDARGRAADTAIHRLGPLIAYTFFDEPGAAFNRPTVLLLTGWHLKHPTRAGQDVSQAMPQLVFGFSFTGDLIDWRSVR